MTRRLIYNKFDINIETRHYFIKFVAANYEPPRYPWHVEMHSHNSYEIHFIASGKGTFITNGISRTVREGDFHITGPDVLHEQFTDEHDPMSEYCLRIDLTSKKSASKSFDGADETDMAIEIMEKNAFYLGKDSFNGVAISKIIMDELSKQEFGSYSLVQLSLQRILILIARSISNDSGVAHPIPDVDMNSGRRWYLDGFFRRYRNPLSVKEAADTLGICTRQFDRIVKKNYGMSYNQKIKQLRIDIAKKLLESGDMPLADIASYIGYETQQYFCKQFKSETGYTPKKYRETFLR